MSAPRPVRLRLAGRLAAPLLGFAAPCAAGETGGFDYVVVGAGAAGSVVASRLSERPEVTVLMLEAGGEDTDPRIHRPSSYRELPGSDLDWGYRTEEEPQLGGRRIAWPRGRVWGGSGSIGAMVYVRGHPRDFDEWEAMGNPGWGWADVLPWFKRAENHERGPSVLHGTGGPQNVADPRWVPPLSLAFLEAAVQAGLHRHDDFNGGAQDGASLYAVNQRNGERHSAAAAYLRPVLHRGNLTVRSRALATRVLVEDGRAKGVAYLQEGHEREARAAREVILCAGTIGSPQLLMLSGIGPAAHLRALGIPVVRDLPGVGENLQDHPRVAVTYQSRKTLGLAPGDHERAARDYGRDRTGPLTSSGVGAGAFVRTSADEARPDVQIIPTANPDANAWSLHVALMRPKSRGSLHLRSSDPGAHPLIRANYLADERDMDALVRGLAIARRLAGKDALAGYRGQEISPGAGAQGGDDLRRHVRENVTTFFHPVGTCRMGLDQMAVVDHELRVHGVAGLRVVDASVMPVLVAGATHAATVMIAEKGAFLVKKGW
jgi:choline dehydrogenase